MALINEGRNQPFFFTDPCKHARESGGWIGTSDAAANHLAPPSPTSPSTQEWGSEVEPHYGYSHSPKNLYEPVKPGDGVAKWEKFQDEGETQAKSLSSGSSKTPKWGYDRDISSILFDDLFKPTDEGIASKWTYDQPGKTKPEYAEMVRKSGNGGASPKFKGKQDSPKQVSTSPKTTSDKPKKSTKDRAAKTGDSKKLSSHRGQKSRNLKSGSRKSKKRRNNKSKAPPGFQGSHLQRAVSRMGKYWDLVPTWYKRKLASGDYFVV